MFASALAGRPVAVAELKPGEPAWTDGQTIYLDAGARARAKLEAVAVQASMIAAGSLDPDVVRRLVRHPRLARRYLAVEGHRALVTNGDAAARHPGVVGQPRHREPQRVARRFAETSPRGGRMLDDPAPEFGVIRAAKVLAACSRAAEQQDQADPGHVPRGRRREGTGGARRRRGRRFRRSGYVHQPRRRGRLHRQVAEEDAVVGAQDAAAAADRPARIPRRTARTPPTAGCTPCRRWPPRRARTSTIQAKPTRTA